MSAAEQRPRPDLSALRIEREPEREQRTIPLVRIIVWAIVLVAAVVGLAFVYNRWIVPARAPKVETVVVKSTVNVVNPPLLTATGYLVADRQSKITPKISGKVVKLNFDVGDKVRRGEVLAVLESTTMQAQLDEANAALDSAQREYNRQAALWKQGVTSRALLDNAEAQLKAARARVEQVRINMTDMTVRAPFDGTIATKNTEVGEVISSVTLGQVSGTLPAGAICTIVDLNTLEVVADVNEGSISQLHEGQPAEVTVDAFPGRKWRGVLRQIIPTADRAKAIVQVKVKIINPDERLLPEMSASASFLQSERSEAELREPARIWLPAGAIVGGRVAVVEANKHIAWRHVNTGLVRENRVEITEGLRNGERVVTENPERLKQGELVRHGE
ncbi:MAG TPA: efflux RND transporter periplasmic adaptor subunit [Thermoanaerobaculia bacterium]|nr:efflux RND transporter periplasmic adaptor subunit [Thermoanaerobaculia bacterium]